VGVIGKPMIAILTQDLMMASSVSSVARTLGQEAKSAVNADRLMALAQQNPVSVLLIDLQLPNLDLSQLLEELSEAGVLPGRIIAYAQHVNVELLSKARKMGVGEVLTRGQVHGNLEKLLTDL
jgi:FixJ family two-component response regulator